jgi:hypothetical protein
VIPTIRNETGINNSAKAFLGTFFALEKSVNQSFSPLLRSICNASQFAQRFSSSQKKGEFQKYHRIIFSTTFDSCAFQK